jgi:hypothetical protein
MYTLDTSVINFHNIIHNEMCNNGWNSTTKENGTKENSTKYIYKHYNVNAFDEFIFDYTSNNEVEITVPIPFQNSSMAYRNIFSIKNVESIYNYIKIHLSNQPTNL